MVIARMLGGTASLAKASTEDYHNRDMRSISILMDRSINILGTEEPGTLTKGRVSKGDLNFNWSKGLLWHWYWQEVLRSFWRGPQTYCHVLQGELQL